jgi:hypothetical protein
MAEHFDGGCLCGAIRYRLTALPRSSTYCHCRMCQRSAGAPVLPWVTVLLDQFKYTSGKVQIYRSSQKAQREFCPDCGTQLVFREHGADSLDITTASLDNPSHFPPKSHIWRESRIPWFETADDLPRHDKTRGT